MKELFDQLSEYFSKHDFSVTIESYAEDDEFYQITIQCNNTGVYLTTLHPRDKPVIMEELLISFLNESFNKIDLMYQHYVLK